MNDKKIHIKSGFYLALILILFSLIINLTGVYKQVIISNIIYLLMVIGLVILCLRYVRFFKEATFGRIFSYGFKCACVTALIMVVWNLLSYSVFFKNNMNSTMEQRKTEMIQQGANAEEVQQQAEFAKKNYFLLTIGSTLFLYALTGVAGSLLGAGISATKKF